MRCERCGEREAVVHLTSLDAASGRMTKRDLCEPCSDEVEAQAKDGIPPLPFLRAGWTSYNPPPPPPPPRPSEPDGPGR